MSVPRLIHRAPTDGTSSTRGDSGMANLAEKMGTLSDPQALADDPDIQGALQACE